jgi:hypothetical protein
MNDKLFEGVGEQAHVGYIAIRRGLGNYNLAVILFERLGYVNRDKRKPRNIEKQGDPTYLDKPGSISIVLIDPRDLTAVFSNENYLAVVVDDPYTTIIRIEQWAVRLKEPVNIYGSSDKYFIELPTILMMPIALVAASKPNTTPRPLPDKGSFGIILGPTSD